MAAAPTQLRRVLAAHSDEFANDAMRLQAMQDTAIFTERLLGEGVPAIQAETFASEAEARTILHLIKSSHDYAMTVQDVETINANFSNRAQIAQNVGAIIFRTTERDNVFGPRIRGQIDAWIKTFQHGGSPTAAREIRSSLLEALDETRQGLQNLRIDYKGVGPAAPERRAQLAS